MKDAQDFQQLIQEKIPSSQEKTYFLIDEIQFVEGWQKIVNALRVSFNTDIVITGSNANLLSGELATLLSGRYVEIKIYPLSLKNFYVPKMWIVSQGWWINSIRNTKNTVVSPVLLLLMNL